MSHDPERQRVMDKIAGLFRLAEGKGTTTAEAATAAAQAQRLLEKYKIERAELPLGDDPLDKALFFTTEHVLPTWLYVLGDNVAQNFGCRIYGVTIRQDGRPTRRCLSVIGRDMDRRVVEYTFVYLHREIDRLAQLALDTKRIYGRVGANNFRLGAVDEIAQRMRLARADERMQATSTAIVRLEQDEAAVVKYMETLKLKRSMSQKTLRDLDAQAAGREAARSINLNPALDPSIDRTPRLKG